MKKFAYIFILLAVPLSLNAYTFTRTIGIGSEGEDVLELQKFLNTNPETRISDTGPGSPGFESTYFGEKTRQAVIKMQNLFAPLILYPVGLNAGNGFVGNSTIGFLNTFLTQVETAPADTSADMPIVESVEPLELKDGDTITIKGKNFSDKNTVIVGFESRYAYTDIKSTDNGTKIVIEYDSSIQEPFDKKWKELDSKAKAAVLAKYPKIPVAVSVIDESNAQSNFKVINFNIK